MSAARTVQPVRPTLSPVMTGRGLGRRLETLELALGDMRAAGDRLGCSVNDIFLAGVTGGLRRYHEQRGAAVERLLMALPISLRSPSDPVGGNRVTMVRFTVPVSEPDLQARIAETQRLVREWRQAPSNAMTQGIAFGLNLAPRRYIGEMFKHVDFIASNVPGLDVPVYVAGARVTGYYPFGPTLGVRVQHHADVLRRHLLRGGERRYCSGARPRTARRLPARGVRRGDGHGKRRRATAPAAPGRRSAQQRPDEGTLHPLRRHQGVNADQGSGTSPVAGRRSKCLDLQLALTVSPTQLLLVELADHAAVVGVSAEIHSEIANGYPHAGRREGEADFVG